MRGILVRVGIDQSFGGWNAPADPETRRFAYVPIPEKTGTQFHPDCARLYSETLPAIESFRQRNGSHRSGLAAPDELFSKHMHLDPDFETLTYGDVGDRRGSEIRNLHEGDLLVFYAGLRDIQSRKKKLIYAIIGLFVVHEIVDVEVVAHDRWHENAHTRKIKRGTSDIVVRAKPGESGRLRQFIPIGDYRSGAYRVWDHLQDAWGGLSVKDGYIQRSVRPPRLLDARRFYAWFRDQNPELVQDNFSP